MQFAHVEGTRVPAAPGLNGHCPACSQPVVAKCGTRRVWHWAHKGKRSCDNWWEPETAWHRRWKDEFPTEWQEHIQHAESGEKHIADVRTKQGLVIEFQHSHLDPEEQASREAFYENLVWVVDGTRLKRDWSRFLKGMEKATRAHPLGFGMICSVPEECFPSAWLNSSKLVIFDFHGMPADGDAPNPDAKLWCLLPGRAEGRAFFGSLSRRDFLKKAREETHILPSKEIMAALAEYFEYEREQRERQARRHAMAQFVRKERRRRTARF